MGSRAACFGTVVMILIEPGAGAADLPWLTNVTAVRALSAAQAGLGYPVRLRAVVTYYDPQWFVLFVQDATAGIFINPQGQEHPIRAGQQVEVDGISAPGDFAPVIVRPRFRVLGETPLPEPRRVMLGQLLPGQHDSQWIEIEGVVRGATNRLGRAVLEIATGQGRFQATIPEAGAGLAATNWIDAEVTLRGACATLFNQRRQSRGIQLYVPSRDQVTVTRPPPADPDAIPAQRIQALWRFNPADEPVHRVRIQGTVTLRREPRTLFIQNADQGLYIEGESPATLRPGDVVEVIGFPAIGDYTPILQEAVVRRLSSGAAPDPAPVTALEAIGGGSTNRLYDAVLVRMTARFLEQVDSGAEQILVFQEGQHVFNAHLGSQALPEKLLDLRKSSKVQLTGVCSVQVDESRRPRAFRILLRSAEDLVVLEQPTWWSARRVGALVAGLVVVAGLAMGWSTMLRRRVRAQTAVIRRQLDQLTTLSGLGQRLSTTTDPESAAAVVVEAADSLLGWDLCTLDLYSALEDRIQPLVVIDTIDGKRRTVPPVKSGDPTPRCRTVLREGALLILRKPPIAFDGETTPIGDTTRPSASLMFAQVRHGTEIIGVLSIQSYRPQAYTREDLETLQALADFCGGALRRIRSEKALHESEQRSRLIADAIGEVFWMADVALEKMFFVSTAYERVWGRSVASLYANPRSFLEAVHADDRARVLATLERERLGGSFDHEYRIVRTDGAIRLIWDRGVPVREGDGAVVSYAGVAQDITDRRRVESALRDAEQQYRAIFENVVEGLFRVTPEGRFLTANPALARILGYDSPEELIMSVRDLGRQVYADPSARAAALVILREQGFVKGFETQACRKDGTKIWVSISSTIVPERNGGTSFYEGVVEDITRRKRAEHRTLALSTLGQRLNSVTMPAQAAQIIAEVSDSMFGWDAFFLDLYSAEKDEVVVLLNLDLIDGQRRRLSQEGFSLKPPPLTRRILEKGRELILRTEPLVRPPEVLPFGDRQRVSASLLFAPVRDGARVVGILSVQSYTCNAYTEEDLHTLQSLADLCGGALDRIQAHDALRESEGRFRRLVEQAADAIFLFTLEGRLVDVNQRACDGLGYSREELLALTVPEIERGLEVEKLEQLRARILAGAILTVEGRHRRKDGVHFPVESRVGLMESGGQPLMLALVRDVTDRCALEAQLRQAQKLESVGKLAAGLAHDFNNLLTVIQGYTNMLQSGDLAGDRTTEALARVAQAAERAANLTRQLLTFSRQQPMQARPIDLNEVIGNVTKMLRRLIDPNVAFHFDPVAGLPCVLADSNMVEQVIINLMVNARDALPKGGSIFLEAQAIEIDLARPERNPEAVAGCHVCLTVRDTGVGMDLETLSRLFEPFFTTKEVGKGTGLGLATVYGIVKQHRGWIEVTSEPDAGSTFKVFLPATTDRPKALPREVPDSQGPIGGRETILLVEDELALAALTCEVLQTYGYQVLQAANGEQALEVWRNRAHEIALLLSDVVLPGDLNGCELADRLRGEKESLRVLFTSGYSPEFFGQTLALQPERHFLSKPYRPTTLVKAVRACLDGRPG